MGKLNELKDDKPISKRLTLLVIIICLMGVFGLFEPKFLTIDNLLAILRQISVLAIIAVGMTFVSLTGGIDFSVGSQMAFSGMLTAILICNLKINPAAASIAGILCCILIGMLNGLLVVRTNFAPLIITLGTQMSLKGLTYIICGGYPVYGLPESYKLIGQGNIGFLPFSFIITLFCILIASFLLRNTYLGVYHYAVGCNEVSAKMAGINIEKIKIIAYSICGFFTGIAAIIMLSRVNSGQPTSGSNYELDVITVIYLGGISTSGSRGKIRGVIFGALFLGILNNGLILIGLGEYYQQFIKGLVLILAVLMSSKLLSKS